MSNKKIIFISLTTVVTIIALLYICNIIQSEKQKIDNKDKDQVQVLEDEWSPIELDYIEDSEFCYENMITGAYVSRNNSRAFLTIMDNQEIYGFIWSGDNIEADTYIINDIMWEKADRKLYLGKMSDTSFRLIKEACNSYKIESIYKDNRENIIEGGLELKQYWENSQYDGNKSGYILDTYDVDFIAIYLPIMSEKLNYYIWEENLYGGYIQKYTKDNNGKKLIDRMKDSVFYDNWINFVAEYAKQQEEEALAKEELLKQEEEAKHTKYYELWEKLDSYEFQSKEDFADFTELDLQFIYEHNLTSDYFAQSGIVDELNEKQKKMKEELDKKYLDRILLYSALNDEVYEAYYVDTISIFGVKYFYLIKKIWYVDSTSSERYLEKNEMLKFYYVQDENKTEEYKKVHFDSCEEIDRLNVDEIRYLQNIGYDATDYYTAEYGMQIYGSNIVYANVEQTDKYYYIDTYQILSGDGDVGPWVELYNIVEMQDCVDSQIVEGIGADIIIKAELFSVVNDFEGVWAHFGYEKLLLQETTDEYKSFQFNSSADIDQLTDDEIRYLFRFYDRYTHFINVDKAVYEVCDGEDVNNGYLPKKLNAKDVKESLDYFDKYRFPNELFLYSEIQEIGDNYEYSCYMIFTYGDVQFLANHRMEYNKTTGIVDYGKYHFYPEKYRDVDFAE